MKTIMEVRDLSVTTSDNTTLVWPISFTLQPGIPLTLLGETGSGKSLLAQALMGNLPSGLKASGVVMIDGEDLMSMPENQRRSWWGRRMTMLPQEPWHALDPIMRVGAQIQEGHQLVAGLEASAARNAMLDDLATLGLNDSEFKLPMQLSGGMAQRAAFAAARAGNAPIVIADEPTKGLDSARRDDVVRLLREALGSAGGLLTITHDMAVAEQLGGMVMIMRRGECLESGKSETVLAAPQSAYGQQLMAANPERWPARQLPPSASADVVLDAREVSLQRGGKALFKDLSLALHRGEILGVNGASGSGKSSLGDLLLGLIPPDSGQVLRAEGIAATRFLKLYQDPPAAFSPWWRLGTLLKDLCKLHKLSWAIIPPLMERLSLAPELLERRPDSISGGELQRFSILRALMLEPVFLFADEPTSRLDPITQQQTLELLIELARERDCALLLVSHDRALVDHACDRQISLQTSAICV
ncbi:ABC transporter ATP-binding protein [Halomonas huangheensis]|uniref:ABC transporter domain-containing protein n=1 Tax=Halomonas huangheensis TaxID=1178482 RepID=W1ND22_9GAMM|nr:ATP-binding cassette domain-containing protein [Halomonas huangheensis]ALM52590.1 ABC transporter ATP-binding protein [Halomonas huangheensis]ERL52900.1 hypothetical protein BJB45_16605 [Halomonas huangheensis]